MLGFGQKTTALNPTYQRLIPRNGHEPTLEEVFLELTGNKLVSEEEG